MEILPIISDLCVVTFNLIIFFNMCSMKRETVVSRIILAAGCACIVAFYFVATYILKWPASISAACCMTIPSMILFFIFSRCKDSRFFMTFCFVDTVSLIIAFMGRYVGVLTGNAGNIVSLAVIIVIYAAIIAVGHKYFKKYAELLDVEKAGWTLMMIAGLLIYFALIFFAAYPRPLIERVEDAPKYLVFCAVVLVCYAVFIHSILKTRKISDQVGQLEKEKKYHRIAYTDALTGLYNRAYYIEKINELQRDADIGSYCCIYIDLDYMKCINDNFGHAAGDEALRKTATALRGAFRNEDLIFRVGGDEFLLICPQCEEKEAQSRLERLTESLKASDRGDGSPLSVSYGYDYPLIGGEKDDTLEMTFARADQKMYEMKRGKKGRETDGTGANL